MASQENQGKPGITYHLERLDRSGARNKCREWGGDLASFHSESEWQEALLNKPCSSVDWIGLNDIVKEGEFVWSDETPYDFKAWYKNEPNNWKGRENCTAGDYRQATVWNDAFCE